MTRKRSNIERRIRELEASDGESEPLAGIESVGEAYFAHLRATAEGNDDLAADTFEVYKKYLDAEDA